MHGRVFLIIIENTDSDTSKIMKFYCNQAWSVSQPRHHHHDWEGPERSLLRQVTFAAANDQDLVFLGPHSVYYLRNWLILTAKF